MTDIERDVAAHYGRNDLVETIRKGLAAAGKELAALRPEDLAPVDEFHIGGRQATEELASQLGLAPGMRVLDVGSGVGGASRYMAQRHGVRVVGVDLTPQYVEAARQLAELVGLADRVEYRQASALALPFASGEFDAATMLHVGMNIADKAALAAELRRALKPGGSLGLYDVMLGGGGEPHYPAPWAATPATSFVARPEAYRRALEDAGFEILATRDRTAFGIAFFEAMQKRVAESGPPPLGLHLLMGADAPVKLANMVRSLREGRLAPTEIVARAR